MKGRESMCSQSSGVKQDYSFPHSPVIRPFLLGIQFNGCVWAVVKTQSQVAPTLVVAAVVECMVVAFMVPSTLVCTAAAAVMIVDLATKMIPEHIANIKNIITATASLLPQMRVFHLIRVPWPLGPPLLGPTPMLEHGSTLTVIMETKG